MMMDFSMLHTVEKTPWEEKTDHFKYQTVIRNFFIVHIITISAVALSIFKIVSCVSI